MHSASTALSATLGTWTAALCSLTLLRASGTLTLRTSGTLTLRTLCGTGTLAALSALGTRTTALPLATLRLVGTAASAGPLRWLTECDRGHEAGKKNQKMFH